MQDEEYVGDDDLKLEDAWRTEIAELAHEVNRALCESMGDRSQVAWKDAPEWQRMSARAGVDGILNGSITSPRDSHASWLAQKRADGWVYGPEKNPDLKQHPCMVEYDELPAAQRTKDYLFFAVVKVSAGEEVEYDG